MGEIVKAHDFEKAKQSIKKFSEQTSTDISIRGVNEKKSGGEWIKNAIFNHELGVHHKVTGEEFNELTKQVQSHFISVNNTQIKLIKEFGEVYKALESLDKDYIQAILISVKMAEETSQGVANNQKRIQSMMEDHKRTLEILKKFKEKLDSYGHLQDIDKLWADFDSWRSETNALSVAVGNIVELSDENAQLIAAISDSLEKTISDMHRVQDEYETQRELLEWVTEYTDKLKSFTHLSDIDCMWDNVESLAAEAVANTDKLKSYEAVIEDLEAYKKSLELIEHLKDVDEMWEEISHLQKQLKELPSKVELLVNITDKNQEDIKKIMCFVDSVSGQDHLMDIDVLWEKVESLDSKIEADTEKLHSHDNAINELNEYNKLLGELEHLIDVDILWEKNQSNHNQIESLKKQAEANTASTEAMLQQMNIKLKQAYLISGGALMLAILELVMLFLR